MSVKGLPLGGGFDPFAKPDPNSKAQSTYEKYMKLGEADPKRFMRLQEDKSFEGLWESLGKPAAKGSLAPRNMNPAPKDGWGGDEDGGDIDYDA
jgi:hypothetical protein